LEETKCRENFLRSETILFVRAVLKYQVQGHRQNWRVHNFATEILNFQNDPELQLTKFVLGVIILALTPKIG